MGLLDSKKDKEAEDTLKVLSTNIEVINQRLSQSSPEYGFAEMTTGIKKSIDMVSEQMKFISNQIKTSEMGVRQLVNYGVTQAAQDKGDIMKALSTATERMAGIVQQNNQVIARMMSEMEDFRKATEAEIVAMNDNVLRNLQATGSTQSSVSGEMGRLKTEVYSLLQEFNKNVSETVKDKAAGEKVDPAVAKEVASLKDKVHNLIQGFQADVGSESQALPKGSQAKISKDIERLRSEMNKKFDIMTDILKDLVQTNMDYVNILKDPKAPKDL